MAQRYKPFVGPHGNEKPPGQPDPPVGEAPLAQAGTEYEGGGYQGPEGNDNRGYGPTPHLLDDPGKGRDPGDGPSPEWEGREEQDDEDEQDDSDLAAEMERRGKAAYDSATSYFDSNFRGPLEDSLRAFNNQHPSNSKYNSESFKKRSNLYRPKTRTIMRKNEAALCAALFSNLDLIECTAANPADQQELVSAEVMQQLLQERLTVTMPWFHFAIGGLQDAMNQGIVICHSYWRYHGVQGPKGYKVLEDRPVQELVAMENFLFDPSAKWYDVVGTSPYLIEKMPMTVQAVKEKMRLPDPKGRKWKRYDDDVIAACTENYDESTRAARTNTQNDAAQHPRNVSDYDIVWVHRHIHKMDGVDYEFYMLSSRHMLTEPDPLLQNVWFGERPYVVGTCILETHKATPRSLATIMQPLQEEANDIDNQLSDNMKFILNKAWFVKRSANVDVSSLVRNVPGRVTQVNDPEKDVKEVNWPDIPQSAFLQKDRNDADFDALAGNFNPMQMSATRSPRESFRTVNAVQSPAMMMTEYTLMTYVMTFLLPALRQLVLLEQFYETDQTLLAIAGQKAQIMQRFGQSEVTDAVLEKRMAVNINIGMGATDPNTKQQRLTGALQTYAQLTAKPIPGLDMKEVGKELFALAGYRDALRFFGDVDPEKARLQQQLKAVMEKLKKYEIERHNKHEANVVKLVTSREGNMVKLLSAAKEDDHQSRHLLVGHLLEMEKMDAQAEKQQTLQAEGAMQAQAGQAQAAALKPPPAQPGGAAA